MRGVAALLFVCALMAGAEAAPQVSPYPPPQILPATTAPCEQFYPYAESAKGIEGQTKLSFVVDPFGHVQDLSVAKSSGNAHLDKAAKVCIARRLYRPAHDETGKPVSFDATETVVWEIAHPPAFAEPPRDCPHAYPVTIADLNGLPGITDVLFSIVDGAARDGVVMRSSGNPDLDRKAVECVATRRFVAGPPGDAAAPPSFRERITWGNGLPPKEGQIAHPQAIGPIHICTNDYPLEARRLGLQAQVTVLFVIAKDGSLKDIHLEKTTGNDALDEASIDCVAAWHYWPVVVEGQVIELPWEAKVNWSLR